MPEVGVPELLIIAFVVLLLFRARQTLARRSGRGFASSGVSQRATQPTAAGRLFNSAHARFCTECGSPHVASGMFCANCGAAMTSAADR